MRKLSQLLEEEKKANAEAPAIVVAEGEWQSLVLFDGVLNGERLLSSPEIQKLLIYYYGQARISIVETNYPKELHDFLRDALYTSEMGGQVVALPVKASFEEMAVQGLPTEYTGPMCIQVIHPDPIEKDFLVLTCRWANTLFHNDTYIIGVIGDSDDLATIVDEYIRRD